MRKKLLLIVCAIFLMAIVAGCSNKTETPALPVRLNQPAAAKVVVGATAKRPHAEILEVAKPLLAKEGVDLEIKVFTDYVQLNPALKDKQIDANFFQHIPYLDDYNAKNSANLVWTVKVHNEPMGVYSKQIKNLDELANGAKVGIPNDATNGGRALMVLDSAGVIKLKEGVGVTATDKDIAENPKNVVITMMMQPCCPGPLMMPRSALSTAIRPGSQPEPGQ